MKQANRTILEQREVQEAIQQIYEEYKLLQQNIDEFEVTLKNNKYYENYEFLTDSRQLLSMVHSKYALTKLLNVGYSIQGLDVGQPWCIYWTLNTLLLLKEIPEPEQVYPKIIKFIEYCQSDTGGFGGGHIQLAHLAPTYSAILTLLLVGTVEAYKVIDRQKLSEFFKRIQNPQYKGSYLMHENGESDLRGVYIVIIMVILLKLDSSLLENCAEYVGQCQTYEGGIGAIPYGEAHGGYAYCGLAGLCCMNKQNILNLDRLIEWLVNRQMQIEGGFNGRTNKVVDSCYTFWQGSIFSLLKQQQLLNEQRLQEYVHICQDQEGGLFDKPGKVRDTYHTMYSLSGYFLSKNQDIDSIYNIPREKLTKAQVYFNQYEQL